MSLYAATDVSILVLMDSRIKIEGMRLVVQLAIPVSILVLMDSRIKIAYPYAYPYAYACFNPCFNG